MTEFDEKAAREYARNVSRGTMDSRDVEFVVNGARWQHARMSKEFCKLKNHLARVTSLEDKRLEATE